MYLSFVRITESLADAEAGAMPQYSWGSAIIFTTYMGMCDASRHATSVKPVLAVCYVLLQLWSWVYPSFVHNPLYVAQMTTDPQL